MSEALAAIESELSGLHKDFSDHTKSESAWQASVDKRLDRIEGRFNSIELNGDGKKYTIEQALKEIFSYVKPMRIRKEFGRRWTQLRDAVPWLHFLFATRPGKFILTAFGIYLLASLLNDVGVLKEQPLPLVWSLIKMIIPKIE